MRGLELSKENSDYLEHLDIEFTGIEIPENEMILKIKEKIISTNAELQNEKYINEIKDLFDLLPQNVEKFIFLLNERYYNLPVFYYVKINDIPSILHNLHKMINKDINLFNNALKRRYHIYKSFLKLDYDNICKLEGLVSNDLEGKEVTLKNYLLNITTKILRKAQVSLKEQKKTDE